MRDSFLNTPVNTVSITATAIPIRIRLPTVPLLLLNTPGQLSVHGVEVPGLQRPHLRQPLFFEVVELEHRLLEGLAFSVFFYQLLHFGDVREGAGHGVDEEVVDEVVVVTLELHAWGRVFRRIVHS